ncbi:MAG: hypothetical protein OXD40_02475 [bacterium]|nr:hypothetical protein [bacterium]
MTVADRNPVNVCLANLGIGETRAPLSVGAGRTPHAARDAVDPALARVSLIGGIDVARGIRRWSRHAGTTSCPSYFATVRVLLGL